MEECAATRQTTKQEVHGAESLSERSLFSKTLVTAGPARFLGWLHCRDKLCQGLLCLLITVFVYTYVSFVRLNGESSTCLRFYHNSLRLNGETSVEGGPVNAVAYVPR